MSDQRPRTLVRYWGSYFKSTDQAQRIASYFSAVAAAGWRSHLVCCQPPEDRSWLMPIERAGIEVHYLPRARGNFDLRCIERTRQLCRDTRADVLHCDNTHTSPLLGAALAGVPVRLWTKHAMQPCFEQLRPPTTRDRLAPSVRTSAIAATRVLPISQAIAAELIDLGLPPRKLEVLLLPAMTHGGVVDRDAERTRFRVPADALVFGTVGRAIPVKGWDLLLDAFAAVRARTPAARLLLVGSVSNREEQAFRGRLDAMVAAHGLGGSVTWTGHVTDVGAALGAMDVFVLPSRSEGFSLALIEALVAGRPVISTRVGIAPDVIVDGEDGLLIPRNDATALASAMARLAADEPTRRRLAGRAAIAAGRVPTPVAHARALFALYERLLRTRGAALSPL